MAGRFEFHLDDPRSIAHWTARFRITKQPIYLSFSMIYWTHSWCSIYLKRSVQSYHPDWKAKQLCLLHFQFLESCSTVSPRVRLIVDDFDWWSRPRLLLDCLTWWYRRSSTSLEGYHHYQNISFHRSHLAHNFDYPSRSGSIHYPFDSTIAAPPSWLARARWWHQQVRKSRFIPESGAITEGLILDSAVLRPLTPTECLNLEVYLLIKTVTDFLAHPVGSDCQKSIIGHATLAIGWSPVDGDLITPATSTTLIQIQPLPVPAFAKHG